MGAGRRRPARARRDDGGMHLSYYSLSFSPAVEHMPKPVSIIRIDPGAPTAPRKAVEALRAGGVLVFPVAGGYVVGCSATNEPAVRRLCEISGAAPGDLQYLAASREQAGRVSVPARISADPVAVALMRSADTPLAVTSCRPGQAPAPTAQHVLFVVGDSIDLVLDAGATRRPAAVAVR